MRAVRIVAVLVALLAPGRAEGLAESDAAFAFELSGPSDAVRLGEAFELRVLRRWPSDHDAVPFDPAVLAPLQVELADEHEASLGDEVEQRLTLRAWAFRPGALRVEDARFTVRPRDGRAAREVVAEPWALQVESVLPEDDAGAMEWPAPLSTSPTSWPRTLLLVLVLVALVASALRSRRERRRPDAPSPTGPVPRARARWRELAAQTPAGADDLRADAEQAADILRDLLHQALAVRVRERTSQELLADAGLRARLAPIGHAALARAWTRLDLTRFAARSPTADERRALFADGDAVLADVERALAAAGVDDEVAP